MEITREIINNSEIRLHITISKLKTILLVCLISFTTLLVRQTLHIQHSCNPMIHWSGELLTECQVATTDNLNSSDRQELPLPKQTHNKVNTNNSKSSYSKTVSEPETQFNSHPNQITYGLPIATVKDPLHDPETEPRTQFNSYPNQITYGPPALTSESSQHTTETKSKNIRDVIVEKAVAVMNFFLRVFHINH